jgi:hypothetical protein
MQTPPRPTPVHGPPGRQARLARLFRGQAHVKTPGPLTRPPPSRLSHGSDLLISDRVRDPVTNFFDKESVNITYTKGDPA